jgi:hypothetical protein
MTDNEKFQKNPEKETQNDRKSSITHTKAHEIVQAFKDAQNKDNPSYFSSTNRNNIVADFRSFIAEFYGDGMLHTLQKEWKLDQAFNEIADRWFTISDFLDYNKKETIKQQLWSLTKESQVISESCMICYNNRSKLNEEAKKKISFEDFVRDAWFDVNMDDNWNIISVIMKKNSKIQSISQLQSSRKEFVRMKTDNSELIKIRDNCMDTSNFDPTEKIACLTTVRTLHDRIQKIDWSKRTKINELFEDLFGKDINKNIPISAMTAWTNFSWLERQLEGFFQKLSLLWLTDNEIKKLKELSIDPKQCIQYGELYKELEPWTYDKVINGRKFSEFDKKIQKICDSLVTTNLINTVDSVIDDVETDIQSVGDVFNIPWSMKSFFSSFSKPDFSQLNITDKENYFSLIKNRESLIEQIQDINDEGKRKSLLQQLEINKKELSDLKIKSIGKSTSNYFQHIGEQVKDACSILWKEYDLLSKQVVPILEKLHDGSWDMSVLSEAEKNILMRVSVVQQLSAMKQSWTLKSMWYNFDQYSTFVLELYDFTTNKSVLKTKDGHYIDLNFTKKRYVGKLFEWQLPNITDGFEQWLENLHVEFELDIKDNPDAIDFLKMITGGNSSQLFQKVPDQTGEEKLITESSKVEMIWPDGEKYEWYLSPALLNDISVGDDDEWKWYTDEEKDSMKNSSNTFVLYSKPVDQFHDDRKVITKNLIEGNKKWEPIYINQENAKDWRINILEHRVTLNDSKINTLWLGHIMAQQYDKEQLLVKDITKGQDNSIESKLNNIKNENFHDKDNHWSSETIVSQEIEWSDSQKDWNALFSNNNKENIQPEIGMRFALQVDSVVKPTIWWPADDPKLLSATIKKIADDGSITFWFDTLTRSWECIIQDRTLKWSELAIFHNKEIFKNITYLGTAEDSKKSYTEILSHLTDTFDKKKYNFWLFSWLDIKDGQFKKWNEPVSFIIPIEQTKKDYYVEYTVEKVWDKYHVKSTGFDAEVPDKDSKKQIQTSFDITTDLSWVLLLLAGKNITPYTKKEKEVLKVQEWWDTLPQKEKKIWSWSTLWPVLKGAKKSVIDGIKKKWWEKKEEELKYLLFTEGNLYRKMSDGPLWKLLWKFDLNAFGDLADEAEAGWMDYHRNKIKWYLDHFSKFNMVYNAPQPTMFGLPMMCKVVESANKSYPNLSFKQRHKVAAVLLRMLDKMKSWYSKDFAQFPRWTYIKLLMWPVAYTSFLEKYKKLELEANQGNSKRSKDKMEQLSMLEYNFIVENTRWWPNMDENRVRKQWQYAFYFQNIYGREYANQLANFAGNVKKIDTDKNDDAIKWHITANNFDRTYKDCKDHIWQLRVADAVWELVALQQIASWPEQANKVIVLMMAGILNGAFVHHLGKDTKEKLKAVFRNASIPFPQWVEHHDWQKKIQAMLTLATWNKWENSFANFKYKYWKPEKEKPYIMSDFDPLKENSDEILWMSSSFVDWMDKPGIWEQVLSFLHMSPESLKTDNNLMRIWKASDEEIVIFDQKVDPFQKWCVNEIMSELYYNNASERWANPSNYNYWSDLSRTATTIEDFYRNVNKYNWNTFTGDWWDHADVIWSQLDNNAPTDTIMEWREYKLAYDINEFFRVFQWIWDFRYDKNAIEEFYKNMIFAKSMPKWSYDRMRLIRFNMTNSLLKKWSVPQVVESTFIKYMKYFEKNVDSFNIELGKLHSTPDASNHNFEYIFHDQIEERIYIPSDQWIKWDDKKREMFISQCRKDWKICMNAQMKQINDDNLGLKWYRQNVLWKKIDVVWKQMRNWTDRTTSQLDNKKILKNAVKITNRDKVDFSLIKTPQKAQTVWWNTDDILRTIDPQYMTKEQLEEQKEIERLRLLSERNGFWNYYGETG